jgi:hypothetical protein
MTDDSFINTYGLPSSHMLAGHYSSAHVSITAEGFLSRKLQAEKDGVANEEEVKLRPLGPRLGR